MNRMGIGLLLLIISFNSVAFEAEKNRDQFGRYIADADYGCILP